MVQGSNTDVDSAVGSLDFVVQNCDRGDVHTVPVSAVRKLSILMSMAELSFEPNKGGVVAAAAAHVQEESCIFWMEVVAMCGVVPMMAACQD